MGSGHSGGGGGGGYIVVPIYRHSLLDLLYWDHLPYITNILGAVCE